MTTDTIKAGFTYLTALVIIVGGFALIYLTRSDVAANEIRLLIAGFIGSALTFLFSDRVASQATNAAVASQPTVTTNAGPPASVTVSPPTDGPQG